MRGIMAFCINCGAAYQEEARFCGKCGSQTNVVSTTNSALQSAQVKNSEETVLWEGKPAGVSDRVKEAAKVNTTTYTITSQRIIAKTGLIGKKIEEVEMLSVKDIIVKQSLSDRLLGVGTITILSLEKLTPRIVLEGVKDAQGVKDIIRKAVREEKAAHNITYREHL
jgi:hypothetical protein